jgi:membrane-associated phospholipid phosphatase
VTRRERPNWFAFAIQILLVASVELGDDLIRGMVTAQDPRTGIANALRIEKFEAAHGIWLEPGMQQFFREPHQLLGLTLSWHTAVTAVNLIYTFGHVLVTLAFALWIYLYRRPLFGFVRNAFFLTNALALVGYETFPVAPPRLTMGLVYQGHPFRFIDTLYQVLGSNGRVEGSQIGYNEFAAMPSLHIAWALLVAFVLLCTARSRLVGAFAAVYPVLMLVTVVVTGNHYLMDAAGGAVAVAGAVVLALVLHAYRSRAGSLVEACRQLWRLRFGMLPAPTSMEEAGDDRQVTSPHIAA